MYSEVWFNTVRRRWEYVIYNEEDNEIERGYFGDMPDDMARLIVSMIVERVS
jgi:hypothetical protein